jgi:cytochrome c-type biogenesis protein CcmH
MTVFWLTAAGLAVLVLALVLRPFYWKRSASAVSRGDANVSIYRDQLRELDADLAAGTLAQADHERARRELEARLLEDVAAAPASETSAAPARGSRALAGILAAAIPLLALGLYFAVGSPGGAALEVEHQANAQQLDAMVSRLAARMRERPEDLEGWKLLGRSYAALGRFPEAAEAYAKALARAPRDAQVLADLADVVAMGRGQSGAGNLQGEPEKLVLRALEIDPQNLKALALAGAAAFQRKDFAAATRYWQRMLPLVPPESEDARSIQASIAEARALGGGKPGAPAAGALQGKVTLSKKLAAQASPDDTVFIFARAAEGPPMPLAVQRVRVRDLPLDFSLDDSMAMAPGMNLSAHTRVVVGARVSKSGQPTAQAGDLQGLSAPVANDARGVSVVIDSVVR